MKNKFWILGFIALLLGSRAFATQGFVAISGTATPLGGSVYNISGEIVDVSAGLNLADAKKVSLEQVKLVAPPHLDVQIGACPQGMGAFLVGSNGGDVFQPTGQREISEGWNENTLILYDFICSKDILPNGRPSPFSR